MMALIWRVTNQIESLYHQSIKLYCESPVFMGLALYHNVG
jgi:hypothetical protein